MSTKTCCVFGAGGWTGRAVARDFVQHDWVVRAFDLSDGVLRAANGGGDVIQTPRSIFCMEKHH
jgi:nucleoside-diphosphate-sugar epimerase